MGARIREHLRSDAPAQDVTAPSTATGLRMFTPVGPIFPPGYVAPEPERTPAQDLLGLLWGKP
jgi:hypothetical protein